MGVEEGRGVTDVREYPRDYCVELVRGMVVLQEHSCFYGRLIKEVHEKRFNIFIFMNKI